jgi:deazaflavin-dependent oxidoreductase (nitroreductase family)
MSDTIVPRPGHVPRIVSLSNPLMRRLLRAGLPAGPNVLLTVRGRASGLPRTFPVALLQVDGRMYVQSPYGEVDWVRNLRVAGEGVLDRGGRATAVDATELDPAEGGPVLVAALAPFRRHRLTARLARVFVPLAADADLAAHIDHVRSHPVFELRPRPATA